ncbi:acetylornithine deacetylase [Strigomonas culicis]|uniref:Acetylornithine deacetylase n=1 Tax=Strigomonas culicis TaxID=28005 RepID=S9UXI2_9TRYP|nr:acetylornithine deacetylase [Strigomonas culicis]|eukprot:EPY33558.1 acetylornithine deacetylase [Strigomonas culicis]
MKGFLAVVLALTPTFLAMPRRAPIHYAFSYSEELGCVGVPYLIRYLQKVEVNGKPFTADGCLIGEPTNMQVYVGNKGIYRWVVRVRGKPIHSSRAMMGTSCNAIDYAAQLVMKIKELAIAIRDHGHRDTHYECPFACVNTGLISGGNAVNTVPEHCQLTFSIRILKDEEALQLEKDVKAYVESTVLPEMRREFADATVTVTRGAHYPAFNGDATCPFTQQAMRLCKVEAAQYMGCGTEGGFFQDRLHVPTVIAGPGDLALAHVADEHVPDAQLQKSTQMVQALAAVMTGMQSQGSL